MASFKINPPAGLSTSNGGKRTTRKTSEERDSEARVDKYKTSIHETLTAASGVLGQIGALTDNEILSGDGEIVAMSADALAEPLAKAIEATPKIRRYMERGTQVSPWFAVAIAAATLAGAIFANHNPRIRAKLQTMQSDD